MHSEHRTKIYLPSSLVEMGLCIIAALPIYGNARFANPRLAWRPAA